MIFELSKMGENGRKYCVVRITAVESRRLEIMSQVKGTPPKAFGEAEFRQIVLTLNKIGTEAYREMTKATPVGVGGRLQRSFTLSLASTENPVLAIGTNSGYALAVEMGRKPGSGISKEGQDSVKLWARRKLGLPTREASSFAYLLSRKYKHQGRGAQGNWGLAQPGSQGQDVPVSLANTQTGSILHKAYLDLQSALS